MSALPHRPAADPATGLQVYLVGGAVRDRLLGRVPAEWDYVVVGATADDLLRRGFKQVGRDFPVFLHPQTKAEYALARTERKTAPGYRGFVVHADPAVTLEEDLRRRDLTINALAEAPDGTLTDPFGGQADLEARVLRHCSPAFSEDPVRILRVARFAARYANLGFRVAPQTQELMRGMVAAGEVDALVPERVWQELAKALGEERPARFFEVLRDCGALARLLPELDRLWGVPQTEKWHPEIDTGIHAMMVVDMAARLSPDLTVRFAALCHDLGKGTTPGSVLPRHHGHEERSVELLEGICDRFRVPNRHRELARITARDHGLVHTVDQLRHATILDLLERTDAFRRPARFAQMLLACEADYRGRGGCAERHYPQAATLRRLRDAAAAVEVQAIATATADPQRIPLQIRRARIAAIRHARAGQDQATAVD
ncbi:multifunctional CCA addition/repair protein [uncultured Thiodictyon sp.]|uniref:multifunctional CCA addition/repair protein n=1 Tax=uncultured Thiodictyon sp. TaxID=1846217 RepID=UPI0025CFF96D|nr:multifunctional CCA addition/repair protein [uncultured Thiodictyon sp.]